MKEALGPHSVTTPAEVADSAWDPRVPGAAPEERLRPPILGVRDELRIEIVSWIERSEYRRRHRGRVGWLTPFEYEMIVTLGRVRPPD